MVQDVNACFNVVHDEEVAWTAHPRFSDILMKQMLTSAANPPASVSRVQVPPGGVIGWHQHADADRDCVCPGGRQHADPWRNLGPFRCRPDRGDPGGPQHTALDNDGPETVELLCFFTPPIG